MRQLKILVLYLLIFNAAVSAQIKIRLFANQSPESALFAVTTGRYKITTFNGDSIILSKGAQAIISKIDGKLTVKTRDNISYISDSVSFSGLTGNDSFSMRLNGSSPMRKYYSGDLFCYPDFGTLVLINNCDTEKYIAGVVKAEGGSGKNLEYFKSQAVIARTYMYRYMDKHLSDGYNLCDNTHCQVYNGSSSDTVLNNAALETKGMVILDKDSTLIISAFHSNCGGETASSEDVWLSSQSYLKRVVDPYCTHSQNAVWQTKISLNEWIGLMKKAGYAGSTDDPEVFRFLQKSRSTDYTIGSFTIPLTSIRADLNLRSTFFSVLPGRDSVILSGRGYGHGVGLCQEGAMVMASRGFNYRQIIDFYYSGVIISDIKNAVNLSRTSPNAPEGSVK